MSNRRGKQLQAAARNTSAHEAVTGESRPLEPPSSLSQQQEQKEQQQEQVYMSHKRKLSEVGANSVNWSSVSIRGEMSEFFKCLNFVLNGFAKRRQPADVSSVQEAVARMMGRVFSREHLCAVLGLCGALQVQRAGGSWRTCVLRLNSAWPLDDQGQLHRAQVDAESAITHPISIKINRRHVAIETKIAHFESVLQSADLLVAQAAGAQLLYSSQAESESSQLSQSSSITLKRQSRALPQQNASFKERLKMDLEKEQEQSASRVLALESTGLGLALLRQQAVSRGEEAAAQGRRALALQARLERLGILAALPRLGDSLRSLALTRNLSYFALPALLASLVDQAPSSLLRSPGRLERCLRALAAVVPEFVQVLPPDDLLRHESVRVNLQAPYKDVRAALKAAAVAGGAERRGLLEAQAQENSLEVVDY